MTPDPHPQQSPTSIINPAILACITPAKQDLVARLPELTQHFLQLTFRITEMSPKVAASHLLLYLFRNPPPPPPPPPATPY